MLGKTAAAAALVAGVLGLGVFTSARAQDAGFYAGLGVGHVRYDIDESAIRAAGATTFSSDNSATGWKVFGGYQFTRNWGVELGYVDLDKVDFRGTVGAVPFTGNADVTAWTLAVVGTLPVSQNFDLFGKLGGYHWKTSATATAAGISASASDNGNDPYGGLGARYNFTRNVGLQAEWEHFAGDDKANFFSVGLRFKF